MLKNKELASYIETNLTKAAIAEEIVKAKIATEIIKSRQKRGMNQKEFAQYMNVSQAMISKWESGECNFSISTISEICGKLSLVFDLQISAEDEYCIASLGSEWHGMEFSRSTADLGNSRERSKELLDAAA